MPNNYSYHLRLFNDYKGVEVVTFMFAPGQSGNANPKSQEVLTGKCAQMNVDGGDNNIILHVKLTNSTTNHPNKVLPRNGAGCQHIIQENCKLEPAVALDAKTWKLTITHTYKRAKIIYYGSEGPGDDIYTDGKTILTDPPQAQTPVTATDKQN